MKYLHVKKLMEHHPRYKDRDITWIRVYFDMLDCDSPEYKNLVELDKWRYIAFIVLEMILGKEIPLDEDYLAGKGFNFAERPLHITLEAIKELTMETTEQSERGTVLKKVIKQVKPKNIQVEDDCIVIFRGWNSYEIIQHRSFKKYYSCLRGALKIYKVNEILQAICNYALVLNDREYYWEYRWTLDKFLQRKNGIDRFIKGNFKLEYYKKKRTIAEIETEKNEGFEN